MGINKKFLSVAKNTHHKRVCYKLIYFIQSIFGSNFIYVSFFKPFRYNKIVMENVQKKMEQTLGKIAAAGEKPKMLLHVCCAPCSSYVLGCLAAYFEITAFFYNPNIYPKEEYDRRLDEFKKFACAAGYENMHIIAPEFIDTDFYNAAAGMEGCKEGGERCTACYALRLEKTAQKASLEGFDYFCTTLSVSPHKNAAKLNELGGQYAKKYGVQYLPADFKKKDGYKKSVQLSKEYGLYRQEYCGCKFSVR